MKTTSILNDFKDILISEEGATGDMECVTVTNGTEIWQGWRWQYNKGTSVGCLGNPPAKGFDWDGIKWKVLKEKKKPKFRKKKCNTIVYRPSAAIMQFPSFILDGKN